MIPPRWLSAKSMAWAARRRRQNNVRIFDAGKNALLGFGASPGNFDGGHCCVLETMSDALLRKLSGHLSKNGSTIAVGMLCLLGNLTGCVKPYDRPEYVEIDTSETGFLIPLEGDGIATGAVSIRRLSEAAQDRDQAGADSASLVAGRAIAQRWAMDSNRAVGQGQSFARDARVDHRPDYADIRTISCAVGQGNLDRERGQRGFQHGIHLHRVHFRR